MLQLPGIYSQKLTVFNTSFCDTFLVQLDFELIIRNLSSVYLQVYFP